MHILAMPAALALIAGPTAPADMDISQPAPATATPPRIESESEVTIIETIAMEIERYRRMTVPVTIKGEGPFRFMVDTGAQATVLSRDLADQLQLTDREGATLVGMASRRVVETTMVPEFELGERRLTIRTAPLVEAAHIGDADGILGLDTLQNQRVLLDFVGNEMQVTDSLGDGGRRSYDIVVRAQERLGQLIIHRASIDGVSVDVVVDTGAQGSIGNFELQRRLRNRRQLGDAHMTDVNGVQISGETRLARRLEIDAAQINNVVVSFADSPTFHALGLVDRPALILGMSELRLFRRVAIDFRSRRVLFDLPGDAPPGAPWHFNSRASRLND
ncbi:retropepsin-like aspartic protease [Aurantiacibacter poecillastricola]|uniref:retropepsin-like aspartic protease n=1 Tax=Aurantiacibacter poecillastricola TaxID=3064385 RepID=UPI00273D5146|nr:retropepsin-like aspartic protease [Aurantiacibacter sp. 219JJ12-13]MDP5263171.1 retropepsin-like aspartic protease [Aurantiacibacter sp. 219JJ12-13]